MNDCGLFELLWTDMELKQREKAKRENKNMKKKKNLITVMCYAIFVIMDGRFCAYVRVL